MSRDLMLPCPTCNGDQFVSHGDRHVENRTERCPNPDCYEGKVPAKTGQTPQTSAGPGTEALLSDPLADLALLEQTERRLVARSKDVPTWDREYYEIETEVGKVRCLIAEVRVRLARPLPALAVSQPVEQVEPAAWERGSVVMATNGVFFLWKNLQDGSFKEFPRGVDPNCMASAPASLCRYSRDPGAQTRATLVNTGTPQVVSPHSGD